MDLSVKCCLLSLLLLSTNKNVKSESEMEIFCNSPEGRTTWNCSNNIDSTFPETRIPSAITILDFSNTFLHELPVIEQEDVEGADCYGDHYLREIYLSHNEIEIIHKDVFEHLRCLRILDLSFNKLDGAKFTAQTFQGLRKLELLNLRGNPLNILKDVSLPFTELPNLKSIDLSHCQIKTIEPNALDHLPFLTTLNLSKNSLADINMMQFAGLKFLKELDLSFNQLTEIKNKTFYELNDLKKLNLDSNKISHIEKDGFEGLDGLDVLSLRFNKLSKPPHSTFEYFQKYLNELDMSGNLFLSIEEEEDCGFTTNVKILKLGNMPRLKYIRSRATKMFPHLVSLYVHGNPILTTISEDAFKDSFSNLKHVYINDNHLETVYHNNFPWKQLETLEWSGNPWNCDCHLKWLVTFHDINTTLTCHAPTKFEGRRLQDLHPLDLKCPRSMIGVLIGVIICLASICISAVAYVIWKYKDFCKMCHPKQGKYVSVYTNDGADDEAKATILPVRDDIELTERRPNSASIEQV